MRGFSALARFTRGIVTDALGVKGALLEADDVVPLERGEGFRTRGGKQTNALVAGSGAASLTPFDSEPAFVYSCRGLDVAVGAAILVQGNAFPATSLLVVYATGAAYSLPTTATDAAGSNIAFTGRTNSLGASGGRGQGAYYGGELWVPTSARARLPYRWCGNRNLSASMPYSTGTVSGTAGSAILTGSGTSWAFGHVGGYVYIDDADTSERAYRIIEVRSATSVVLDRPLAGDVAAATAYRITANAAWTVKAGTFGAPGQSSVITSRSTVFALGATEHQGRVFVWYTGDADNRYYPDRVRWSATLAEVDGHWGGAEWFHPNAFVDVFPGAGSGDGSSAIFHACSWRGSLYLFKTGAIYALRGFVATDGTDEGASVELIANLDDQLLVSAAPVATDDGIFFATRGGLCVLSSEGITNLSVATGTRELFERVTSSGTFLSVLGNRIVLHAPDDASPNTLVYYRRERVWVTQTTLQSLPVFVVDSVGTELSVVQSADADALEWSGDHEFATLVDEDGRYPTMIVQTHPVSLGAPGAANGRVRRMQVRAKVVDTDATDPVLDVSLLLGEEGTNTAVEAAIAATSDVEESVQTEKWNRVSARRGTPPVDSVRVRLVQEGGSRDIRVTEVGIEHVPVRRLRP